MDRGAWWATVHGVTESDMTEGLSKGQPKNQLFLSASHNGENTCEVFFFTFYWRLITLQQSGVCLFVFFLPNVNMNQPQVNTCSLSLEPASRLSPNPTPLDYNRALDLCSLCHTENSPSGS